MLNFNILHSEWHSINLDPKQVRQFVDKYDLNQVVKVYGSCIQYTYYRDDCITLKDLLDLYVYIDLQKGNHVVYIRIGQIYMIIQAIIQAFNELQNQYRVTHGNINPENILIRIQNKQGFTAGRTKVAFKIKFINFAIWQQQTPTADLPRIIQICQHLVSFTKGVGPYQDQINFFNKLGGGNNCEQLFKYKIPFLDEEQSLMDKSRNADSDKRPLDNDDLIIQCKPIAHKLQQQDNQQYYKYLYNQMTGVLSFYLLNNVGKLQNQQQIEKDFWDKHNHLVKILESNNLFVYLIFFEIYKFSPIVYKKMLNTYSDFLMLDLNQLEEYLMNQQDLYLQQLSNTISVSIAQIDLELEQLFGKILQLILKDLMKQIKQLRMKNPQDFQQKITQQSVQDIMQPKIMELTATINKIMEIANEKAIKELGSINTKLKATFKNNLLMEFNNDLIKQVVTGYLCDNNYTTFENFKTYSKLESPEFTKRLGCAILDSNRQKFKEYFKDIFTEKN